jgi:hypothetical protein
VRLSVLRERIRGGNLGLRDPRSIVQRRNTLFAKFGGKVPLRPAQVKRGEEPYLIARVGLNRADHLQAAGSCVEFGSGGAHQAPAATRQALPLDLASQVSR